MSHDFDLCTIGSGPAGALLAREMSKKGWRVALVDPPLSADRSIGETVPGIAKLLLRELGLWREFQDQGHRPAYARRSVWGDDTVQEQSCLFDPDGSGFHLDRARFDRWLREQALASGVYALRVAPKRLEKAADGRIAGLVLKSDEAVTARYFVDATGRASWLHAWARNARFRKTWSRWRAGTRATRGLLSCSCKRRRRAGGTPRRFRARCASRCG